MRVNLKKWELGTREDKAKRKPNIDSVTTEVSATSSKRLDSTRKSMEHLRELSTQGDKRLER